MTLSFHFQTSTLDDLPCDIFYAALRLFDLEKDKHNALSYADLLIKINEVSEYD